MATFMAIKNKKQTAGVLGGVLRYVQQEKKTCAGGFRFITGHNCVPQSSYIEMMTTKQRFKKTDGRQFYHFVQSSLRQMTSRRRRPTQSGWSWLSVNSQTSRW